MSDIVVPLTASKCALVVRGIFPKLNRLNISNKAWKNAPLKERFQHASYTDHRWIERVDVYYSIDLNEDDLLNYRITSASARYQFDMPNGIRVLRQQLQACEHIYCTLESAVAIRLSLFDYYEFGAALRLVYNLDIELVDPPLVIKPREDLDHLVARLKLGNAFLSVPCSTDVLDAFEREKMQSDFDEQHYESDDDLEDGFWDQLNGEMALFSDFTDAAKNFTKTTLKADALIEQIQTDYSAAINYFKDFFSAIFPKTISIVLDDILLFIDFIRECASESAYGVVSCILRLLNRLGIAEKAISQFLNWYHTPVKPPESLYCNLDSGLESLGDPSDINYVQLVGQSGEAPAILLALTGLVCMKSMPSTFDLRYMTDMCRSFNIFVPTFKNFSALFADLPNWLPAIFGQWVNFLCPASLQMWYLDHGFRQFCNECDLFLVPDNEMKIKYDRIVQGALLALRHRATEIIDDFARFKTCPSVLMATLVPIVKKLDQWRDAILDAEGQRPQRKVPYIICIFGPPNTGKSTMSSLFAQLLKPKDWPDGNLLYARSATDPFWSRYNGQFGVSLDDLNAFKDDLVIREFLTMASNVPMPLNMPSLNDPIVGRKGTAFSSSLVVYTTNHGYPHLLDMHDPEAFYRRRNKCYRLTVKPEYVNERRQPMYDRIPIDINDALQYLDWVEFEPLVDAPKGGRMLQDIVPMTTEQVFRDVLLDFYRHSHEQRHMMGKLSNNPVVAKIREEFGDHIMDGQMYAPRFTREQQRASDMLDSMNVTDPKTRKEYLQKVAAFREEVDNMPEHVASNSPPSPPPGELSKMLNNVMTDGSYGNTCETNRLPMSTIHDSLEKRLRMIELTGDNSHLLKEPTWYATVKAELEAKISSFYEEYPELTRTLAIAGIIVSASFMLSIAKFLYSSYKNSGVDHACRECYDTDPNCKYCMRGEANPYYKDRTARPIRNRLHANTVLLRGQAYEELLHSSLPIQADIGAADLAENVYGPSLLILFMPGVKRHVTGLRIGADAVLTVKHFFYNIRGEQFPKGTPLVFVSEGGVPAFRVEFDPKMLFPIPNTQDSVIYLMGPRINSSRNLLKHFISRDDVNSVEGKPGMLLAMREKDTKPHLVTHTLPTIKISAEGKKAVYHFDYDLVDPKRKIHRLLKYYYYYSVTQPGDCGGVLCILDRTMTARLCGLHVARGEYSASEPIFREDLEEAFKIAIPNYLAKMQGAILPSDTVELLGQVRVTGNFTYLGAMPRDKQVACAKKSSIRPSMYYELFGKHWKEPAVLVPGDPRLTALDVSPIFSGLEKYGQQSGYFDNDICDVVYESLYRQWGTPSRKPWVLSTFESINGTTDDEYIRSIDMDTSPGYAYKMPHSCNGVTRTHKFKRDCFLGDLPSATILCDLLETRLHERETLARNGLRIPSIWVTSLKDELRPLEKIQLGKTRVFANGELDNLLVARRYTMCFAADFYRSRIETDSAVGIDVDSNEWNRMIVRLTEMSRTGFAGDFGRFDGTLAPQGTWLFMRLMNDYYGGSDDDSLVRAVLVEEMIHNIQLCMDTLVMTHGGNPSGNALTVILNSVVHSFYLRYVWFMVAPKEMRNMCDFDLYVRMIVYGDDDLIAVHPHVETFFNMHSVTKAFAQLGIEYLPPSKEKGSLDVAPIVDWTFLKHHCRHLPNPLLSAFWFGALDQNTITEMSYWIRDAPDPVQASIENANTALRHAFFWGAQYFNFLRKRFILFHQRKGLPLPSLITYNELYMTRFSDESMMLGEMAGGAQDVKGQNEAQDWNGQGNMTNMSGMQRHGTPPFAQGERTGANAIEGAVGGSSEGVIQEKLGVAIADQQIPVVVTVSNGSVAPVVRRAEISMPDKDWTYHDNVNKPTPVATFTWTTSQTRGTLLAQFLLPHDLLQTNTISLPFRNFTFWNGFCLFEIKVNGVPQQQGCLVFYYTPLLNKSQQAAWHGSPNYAAIYSVQNVEIEPGANKPMSMLIGFNNINQQINLKNINPSYDFTGTIGVTVMNQLRAGTGVSNSCTITIHASFPNSHFHLPQAIGYTPTERWGLILKLEHLADSDPSMALNVQDREKLKKAATTVKRLRDAMGGDFDLLDDVDMLIGQMGSSSSKTENNTYNTVNANDNVTVPIKTDSKGGSSEATGVDTKVDATIPASMDKVNLGAAVGNHVIQRTMNWTSHAAGIELLHRFSLYANSLHLCDHEHFGTVQDEMSLSWLFSKLTFMSMQTIGSNTPGSQSIVTITTSTAVNTVVASGYICPCPKLLDTFSWVTNDVVSLDLLSYLSAPMTFWKGGLVFKFRIICTPYHSIRLVFTPSYGQYTVPTSVSATSDQMSYYMDVTAEHHEMMVQIPYHFQRQYNRVPHGPNTDKQAFAIGVWSLRTQTLLVAPDNVANFIEIDLFQGGAPDYEIAGMFDNNSSLTPLMGQANDASTLQVDAHLSTAPIFKRTHIQFGEVYTNIKDFLKRYWVVGNMPSSQVTQLVDATWARETNGAASYARMGGILPVATALSYGTSLYFGVMYGSYRGSMRFRMIFQKGTNPIPYNYEPSGNATIVPFSRAAAVPDEHTIVTFVPGNQITATEDSVTAATFANWFGIGSFGDNTPTGIPIRNISYGTDPQHMPLWAAPVGFAGGLFSAGETITRPATSTMITAMPFDIVDRFKPNHEIEIPFSTEYETLYTPFRKPGTQFSDRSLYNPGTLAWGKIGIPWMQDYIHNNATLDSNSDDRVLILASVGDEFKYGAFLGPVTLKYKPVYNIGSSTSYFPMVGDTYQGA